jgi:hypothetical protein
VTSTRAALLAIAAQSAVLFTLFAFVPNFGDLARTAPPNDVTEYGGTA